MRNTQSQYAHTLAQSIRKLNKNTLPNPTYGLGKKKEEITFSKWQSYTYKWNKFIKRTSIDEKGRRRRSSV